MKPDKQFIADQYNAGLSIRQIEAICPVKRTRIGSILKEMGVEPKSRGNSHKLRRYKLNESYFDKIDTEEKAYWLGFIMSDGHTSKEGIHIALQEEDKLHLYKLLYSIGSNAPVKHLIETKAYRTEIYSISLVASLRNLGVANSKAHTTFPSIDKELYRHLIRGVLDADGSIAITKNTYKTGINNNYSITICGTHHIVSTITSIINNTLNLPNFNLYKVSDNFYTKGWGGNKQAYIVAKWLYENATTYLDRKYNRYLELRNINE